jgi:hypothetical protein
MINIRVRVRSLTLILTKIIVRYDRVDVKSVERYHFQITAVLSTSSFILIEMERFSFFHARHPQCRININL